MSFEMSFEGLSHGGFVNSEAYQTLQDGLTFNEITPDLLQDISKNIMDTFGYVCPDIYQTNILEGQFFNNAAMETIFSEGQVIDENLLYDQNFIWHIGQQYGVDAVSGVIAHEMGHQITNVVYTGAEVELSNWHNELCADYISGIVTRLADLSPDAMHGFYAGEAWMPSESHPAGGLRTEAFDKGYEWASHSMNNTFAEFILDSPSTIQNLLEENVVNYFTTY
jgi:hypothetical protein